ncbi:tetratricopeptide repeat protein, partial [Arthrospira platensis SPKY1]|nr:tetratricopeptide repeat protein [Arthrospira platensis SPKY1]
MGREAYQRENYNASLTYFKQMEQKGPQLATDAWLGQAQALTALGDFTQATLLYQQVLAQKANDPAAQLGLGVLELRQQRYESALERLKAVAASELSG